MMRWWLLALIAIGGWQAHSRWSSDAVVPGASPTAPISSHEDARPARSAAAAPVFHCDGRIHCSQMTSREEADYFVAHCPGARMDGDRDGEACEHDTRW
ncbi:excalibur calcium-binding domain-containing protein [Tolypothrix campylonemoides VB511288]|nr:excalibur calcium-binding domain-containing protein [Tolypothrix campylonemoides VB511288]